MPGKIPVSQIPVKPFPSLPPEVREFVAHGKNHIRAWHGVRSFQNKRGEDQWDGAPLPKCSAGCGYVEYQVGAAHPNDPRRAGKRRLVFEVHIPTRKIQRTYYTDRHYAKGSFIRIV